MPYGSNADLPDGVRNALPSGAQSIYRSAHNACMERDDASEERCARMAWGAVENAGYARGEDGTWRQTDKRGRLALEFKAFPLEIKDLDEQGRFTGRVSVYEVEDEQGDLVARGAFRKTLEHLRNRTKILWQHDPRTPIGTGELKDRQDALWVDPGQLALGTNWGRDAYEALKAQLVDGLSIGYKAVNQTWRKAVRVLNEIALMEVSLVTFPANTLARVTSIKGALDAGLEEVRRLLEGPVRDRWPSAENEPWPYIRDVFPDRVIVDVQGQLYSVPFSLGQGGITLGEATEVRIRYDPVADAPIVPEDLGPMLASLRLVNQDMKHYGLREIARLR